MSKAKVAIRDVSPFLQVCRNFLLGRSHTLAIRFEDAVATRTPPPPVLPDGPSHKLNNNYYYARDARREVEPPVSVMAKTQQIASPGTIGLRTPGPTYFWD